MQKIDVVITWVDGNDPKWLEEFHKYRPTRDGNNTSVTKFRDWDTLRFVLRGIEEFMPWVHRVHFVTQGHLPQWMNTKSPKLNIVTHEDIFKDKSHLPTFNSSAIELNLPNIEELSEQFIYFNDDTLVLQPTTIERVFVEGKPRDFLIQTIPRRGWLYYRFFSNVAWRYNINNNVALINRHFNKQESVAKYKNLYYSRVYGYKNIIKNYISNLFKNYHYFEHYHQAQPLLKSMCQEALNSCKDEVESTLAQKFRKRSDITGYIFRYWHLVSGNFVPHFKRDFFIEDLKSIENIQELSSTLKENRYRFVCLNDESGNMSDSEFIEGKEILYKALSEILPNPSSYEISS